MSEFQDLSDRELRSLLAQHGIDIPVTKSTRDLAIKQLMKRVGTAGNGTSAKNVAHEEEPPVNNTSTRRRSVATKSTKSTRSSIAPAPQIEQKTDDSDDEVPPPRRVVKKPVSPTKSLNGASGSSDTTNPVGHLSDEELLKQLTKYGIPGQVINQKNRPILLKKLNHAMAKTRRESKTFTPSRRKVPEPEEEDSDKESEEETDATDNASFVSATNNRASIGPSLSFSPQHSTDNNSSYVNDLLLKPRFPEFARTIVPTVNRHTPTITNNYRPSPSILTNRSTPSRVTTRFVEEQYETGSDSENEKEPVRTTPKKIWRFIPSWFTKKTTNLTMSTPVKKSSVAETLKSKVSFLWSWQFITVVLPVLAIAFFAFLAAIYIRASYVDQIDATKESSSPRVESFLDPVLLSVKSFLEKDAVAKLCRGEEISPLEGSFLIEQLDIDRTGLNKAKEAADTTPQLGIKVEEDSWSMPNIRSPLWCSIKTYIWNTLLAALFISGAFGILAILHQYNKAKNQQREKEEQEVYGVVEKIIDLLARHQSDMVASGKPEEAYLAVNHVRDLLIPLKERKSKQPLWNKAVQFLEESESRVRAEIQQIKGEDFRVWRWLPPSSAVYSSSNSPSAASSTDSTGSNDVVASSSSSPTANPLTPRPKVWQGQAFSMDSSGVNSPPPYPLTQCLKVRNMFDAEVEVGENWPVRIQDAILEKAEGGKVMHIAVDRGSREGCVYIKCANADEAGKVYRALHGWWFDGNLVTVKYLRPERYHHRFPDSASVTVPLRPSNDKRLSLQTKFWKSPMEHI